MSAREPACVLGRNLLVFLATRRVDGHQLSGASRRLLRELRTQPDRQVRLSTLDRLLIDADIALWEINDHLQPYNNGRYGCGERAA